MKPINDLTGKRIGKLIVIGATSEVENHNVVYECKCDCGNTVYLKAGNIERIAQKPQMSCGCLAKRKVPKTGVNIDRINSKSPPKNSITGIQGVTYMPNNKEKYRVRVDFCKERIEINDIEDIELAERIRNGLNKMSKIANTHYKIPNSPQAQVLQNDHS